jgi:hypothetical protein
MLNLHAIPLVADKKPHVAAIDYSNVLQIRNDVAAFRWAFKKSPQLNYLEWRKADYQSAGPRGYP